MALKLSVRLRCAARRVCEAAHKCVRPFRVCVFLFRVCVRPYTPLVSPYEVFALHTKEISMCAAPLMKVCGRTPSRDYEYDEHDEF